MEIISDYFPVFHAQCSLTDCSQPLAVWAYSVRVGRSLSGSTIFVLSAGPSTFPSLFVAARRRLLVPRSSFGLAALRRGMVDVSA